MEYDDGPELTYHACNPEMLLCAWMHSMHVDGNSIDAAPRKRSDDSSGLRSSPRLIVSLNPLRLLRLSRLNGGILKADTCGPLDLFVD